MADDQIADLAAKFDTIKQVPRSKYLDWASSQRLQETKRVPLVP